MDAVAPARTGPGQPARRFGWSGPGGEEFAPDKSASAGPEWPAGPLPADGSGTSRRNVLGAIALEKNDCSFPWRSDDNRDESPEQKQENRIGYIHHR